MNPIPALPRISRNDPFLGAKLGLLPAQGDISSHALSKSLCQAAERGFHDVCSILLVHFAADPNATNIWGETPAMIASKCGQAEALRVLAPASDLSIKTALGETALMLAADAANLECCEILAPLSDPNARSEAGWTALMHACSRGCAPCAAYLGTLTKLSIRNSSNLDALSLAAKHEHVGVIKALMELPNPPLDSMVIKAISASRAWRSSRETTDLLEALLLIREEKKTLSRTPKALNNTRGSTRL